MRTMHVYQAILPEHLPDHLEIVKGDVEQSAWFRRVVACPFELMQPLAQPEGQKKLPPVSSRFFDTLLNETYRAAAPYDQYLAYYQDRISCFRKEEFKFKSKGARLRLKDRWVYPLVSSSETAKMSASGRHVAIKVVMLNQDRMKLRAWRYERDTPLSTS